LRTNFQCKLLELSRDGRGVSLDQLAHDLQAAPATLISQAEHLRSKGLANYRHGRFDLDTRQRIMLAEELIHSGRDPHIVSRFLDWQEFEDFSTRTFEGNGFRVVKHLIFKTRPGRREIDILAWNDSFLFAVDCKHWLRGLSASRVGVAVRAQVERAEALAGKPELLIRFGVTHFDRRRIVPVILTLSDPRLTVVNGVPVVSVSKLMSFLYGISPVDERFRSFPVKNLRTSLLTQGEPKP
jgi:Restriction endonuclease